ncbi:hypothetical protein ACIHCM_17520 [Streptomyces sp. NPDC052023]|uniref:hypothetical protein n=1 Tax=Streptomyces sp. NPDC052023 TaxID=3365681 RepID=UPI0037D13749
MRAESSPAARRGALIAVAAAPFCLQLDFFFALNPALPGGAREFAVPRRGGAGSVDGGVFTEGPEAAYDAIPRVGEAVMPAASADVTVGPHRQGAPAGAAPLAPRAPHDGRLP